MDPAAAKTAAAATGATLTALTMTPFDVIKTRMQTQPPPPLFPRPPTLKCCQPSPANCIRNMSSIARPLSQDFVCLWEDGIFKSERVNGFWDATVKVCRTEGIRGLWKGAGTSLAMGVPAATGYMLTYDHLQKVVIPSVLPYTSVIPMISGIVARGAMSTLTTPLELLRTNLQATPLSSAHSQTLRSVYLDLKELVHTQGIRSLWRGLGPTLWRDVPFSGIYWANYELGKEALFKHGYSGPSVHFISGALSGITAAVLTSPFDVLKTRRQALLMTRSFGGSISQEAGLFRVMSQIIRTEGVPALFAGLSPRIAKIAPACGIMIACFENVGPLLTRSQC